MDEIRNRSGSEDWGLFPYLIVKKLGKYLKDESLRDWVLPNFTTRTKTDQAVASVVMMSWLKKYFTYGMEEYCGIPTVTLLGEKTDWMKILVKIGK